MYKVAKSGNLGYVKDEYAEAMKEFIEEVGDG